MRQQYPPRTVAPPPQRYRLVVAALLWATLWLVARPGYGQETRFQCSARQDNVMEGEPDTRPRPCYNTMYVRVNVHFMLNDDGTGNFRRFDSGHPCTPDTINTGYLYAQSLIGTCNNHQDVNPPLNLAPGNALTPQPKRIKWVLHGVYFDKSTTLRFGYNAASPNGGGKNYGPLCVQADSVINIFLTESVATPFTSLGPTCPHIGTPYYSNGGYVYSITDCATSGAPAQLYAVVHSPWTNYILDNQWSWKIASAVNHELFHLLGLKHPFEGGNGCTDTPYPPSGQASNLPYKPCYNIDSNNPYCDDSTKVSNNLMDYDANQYSLSPCQLGIAQGNLSSCLHDRYVSKCSTCLPPDAWFTIAQETYHNRYGLWLEARAVFNAPYYKLEIDDLAPADGIVAPGPHYEITRYNTYRREYLDGLYSFQAGHSYRIKLTAYNYNCNGQATYSLVYSRPQGVNPGPSSSDFAPGSTLNATPRHD